MMFADRCVPSNQPRPRDHGDRAEVEGSQRYGDVLPPMLGEVDEIGSETTESSSPRYLRTRSSIDSVPSVGMLTLPDRLA